jgi:hypothetical protein
MSKQTDLINIPDAITVSGSNVGIGTSSPTAYTGYSTIALNGTTGGALEFKKGDTQMARITNAGDLVLQFATNNTERLRIDSDGLKFNGDTAAANALDDYEEGDWTPTPNSGSFSASGGKYTKIGRVVTLNFDITVGSGGGSQITLPFSAATTTSNAIYTSSQNFATGRTAFYGVAAGANMYFRVTGDNVTYIAQTFDVGATIHASITYHTT